MNGQTSLFSLPVNAPAQPEERKPLFPQLPPGEIKPKPKEVKTDKKTEKPKFVEPKMPPGAIGGIIADRSDVQEFDPQMDYKLPKMKNRHPLPEIARIVYSPTTGLFRKWVDYELHSSKGKQIISVPLIANDISVVNSIRLGDWITILNPKLLKNTTFGDQVETKTIRRTFEEMTLDLWVVNRSEDVIGEGKIHRGIDSKGRKIFIPEKVMKEYFGSVKKRTLNLQLRVFDDPILMPTLWDILDVIPPVSDDEIKDAYRQKAKELHPDVNNAEDAGQMFQQLNEAYQILQDAKSRKKYQISIDLLKQNFYGTTTRRVMKVGTEKGYFYPPINSSENVKVVAANFGASVFVQKIIKMEPTVHGDYVRVAFVDGGTITLYWGKES